MTAERSLFILLLIMLITSICDTASAIDIDTDYYRAFVNTDGSLNFINKSTGATILSNSPKFYLNYGATTSTAIAVPNNSFEIDDNHDNIPDNWSVDKAYIRLSTKQASDGSKSLKFNATTPDIDHRHAYSSLITIPQDANYTVASYTISIDSFMSSFTPGAFVGVYAYYYETGNGTGTAYVSSNYLPVPTYTGSWVHNSFNWTPPASARSFKLLIYMDHSSVATVFFDNVSITEKGFVYGTTTSTPKAVTNSSFEIDDNHDNIPDSWYVDKDYIRLSTEQASDGSKSLKFNATTPDINHRNAYSPLITVTPDARYTISIDSYVSTFSSGYVVVYAYYYETMNGTGIANVSSAFFVPIIIGSWVHNSFDWKPPMSAQSFRLLICMDKSSVATIYFDNVSITETTYDDVSNSSDIEHTLIVNGDTTTITATDNANPYTIVNHQYQLNTHSPYINYTVTLQYKQDVFTTEERFDFVVPSQNAQVMTRDLRLTSFNTSKRYWSDIYTPKVVRFANGLSFLGSDTMESMRLRTSGSNSQVSFYSDYGLNHPHFYTYVNETQRSAGDTYSASVTFAIDTNESLQYLVKTRQPYGYDAVLTFTNHADNETLARIKAVAYGTENESNPNYGTKGIAARGIGWTKSVFVSGANPGYASLADADFKTLIDQLYQDGVEIIGHSITPGTDSRSVVTSGLTILSQYNAKSWIDHARTSNWEDLASQGAIKGDTNYILDILDEYNYQYAWSYIDLTTDNYALNMLKPSATADIRPFLFYNNRVDDNVNDNKKIYLWSTIFTNYTPEVFYTSARVDSLISERGVHISHEYLGNSVCENHAWYNHCGTIEIYPTFDCQLEYIAGKRAAGLLWSPTMAGVGDYLVPLKDVLVTYNSDGTVTVTNNSLVDVTGITLLAENDIQSVTIDNYDLVSFGDSYGDKEMVLPTIASGDSVVLNISYGAKDSSVPTIVSNDTGKNKVNEITGYWDDISKILTMTAEGHSGDYSFTVTIPSLANRTVIVKDITLDTIIGEYVASGGGAISFTAPLGFLHTFKIANEYFSVVDDFSLYESTGELQNIWHPYFADIQLNTDPNFTHGGGRSIKFEYQGGAHIWANTVDDPCLPSLIGRNWTLGDSKILTLDFYGSAPNSVLPMYVKLKDGSGNEGVVTYGDNGEDPNDLRAAGWHEWDINLGDFHNAGVDLTNIKDINLGFGAGEGNDILYFANIKLSPPKCLLSKRSGDFAKVDYAPAGNPAGDCKIDYQELEIMADYWLMTPPPDYSIDLNGDGTINFRDFAVLVDMWLEEQLWP